MKRKKETVDELDVKSLLRSSSYFDNEDSCSESLTVCIDTEYEDRVFLTLQIYVPLWQKRVLVLDTSQHLDDKQSLLFKGFKTEFLSLQLCDEVMYCHLNTDIDSVLHDILIHISQKHQFSRPKSVKLLMFYAVNDLYPCFGFKNLIPAFYRGRTRLRNFDHIYKNRNLKGFLKTCEDGYTISYTLFDISGLDSPMSLFQLAQVNGIKMLHKSDLDAYKSCMSKALFHKDASIRRKYVEYAMDDCIVLDEILTKRHATYNQLLVDCLQFPPQYQFSLDKFPSTVGSLVSTTFEKFIYFYAEQFVDILSFKMAVCKVGYLDPSQKDYKNSVKTRKRLFDNPNCMQASDASHMSNRTYMYNALNMTSIPLLSFYRPFTHLSTSANVTGGRCINERYKEYSLRNVLDLDFVSCYGSSLQNLEYPIGRPQTYAHSINTPPLSLKSFLKRYRKHFSGKLWKIVVSGKLSFEQDLVYSKRQSDLKRLLKQKEYEFLREQNSSFTTQEHIMLRKEIINGVITRDMLEIIEKVSTFQEFKQWMALEVQSAVWFPKDKQMKGVKEWTDSILSERSKHTKDLSLWFSIPLRTFIAPLLEKRKQIKAEIRSCQDEDTAIELKARDKSVKLIVNTLYGCIASPHFRVGNVVVADNITAAPRAHVWLATKACNGIQSITDGFAYQPERLNRLRTELASFQKPGFHNLACLYRLQSLISVENCSLQQRNWELFLRSSDVFTLDYNELDRHVLNHINDFWSVYDLRLGFQIEHKMEHTSLQIGFLGKANCCFKTIEKVYRMKSRGHDKPHYVYTPSHIPDSQSPMHRILYLYCEDKPIFEECFTYYKKHVIGIPEWKVFHKKNSECLERPGDFVKRLSQIKLNANHMPSLTEACHKKKMRAYNSKKGLSYHVKHKLVSQKDIIQHMIDHTIY